MKRPFIIFSPIVIFIFSLLALCASQFLFLHWYFRVTNALSDFIIKFHLGENVIMAPRTWVIVLISSILIGLIVAGLVLTFTYYQKSIQLYHLQENFINNFTHELKTPLASIKLYLETFVRHELKREKQLEFIKFMLKDTKRLSDHVNQILEAGALESKNRNNNYSMEQVNIKQFILDFINCNKHIFQEGKIEVFTEATELTEATEVIEASEASETRDIPDYVINKSLFEMLLMNLIGNAYKYNQQKEISVKIKISRDKYYLYLSFIDNGIGIGKKDIKHIFKKFYQPVGTINNSGVVKGSGLGLYISQQIVKMHKGDIEVKSAGEQMGSEFIISLPLVPRHKRLFAKLKK
ncbi:MAG: HAMP domain-containing histidine kinase [Oligoflexia bacterium]|nr:HAMP domain-containing histidine kinase [Oligoflexia bacterium]